MFTFPISSRQDDQTFTRRQRAGRRPRVEDLEGRQLLAGIQGNHIGTAERNAVPANVAVYGTDSVRFLEYDSRASLEILGPRNLSHDLSIPLQSELIRRHPT
jgi:hypothetical protein